MEFLPIFQPHSLSKIADYDAIGFDVDHCLTRYKIKNLATLIYENTAMLLKSVYNYPDEIFKLQPCSNLLDFGLNCVVVDIV